MLSIEFVFSIVFSTIAGASLVSYYNVIVNRESFKDSLFISSKCDNCNKKLNWWNLVPIFSIFWILIFQSNKTNCCGSEISVRYLLTESLGGISGLLFAIYVFNSELSIYAITFNLIAASIFLFIAIEDIWNFEISLSTTLLLLLFGLFSIPIFSIQLIPVAIVFAITSVIILSIIYFNKGGGMGIGDLFLIAFIYLNLGAMQGLAAMLVTIYLATIIGLGYAVIRRKLKGLIIPLAPFLFFSWLLITVFPEIGSALLSLYMF